MRQSRLDVTAAIEIRTRPRRTLLYRAILISALLFVAAAGIVQGYPLYETGDVAPAAQRSGVLAIVSGGGASLLSSPGGDRLSELPAGAVLTAVGRTADGAWTAVNTSADNGGWVASAEVVMFGGDQLPVLSGTGLPVAGGGDSAAAVDLPTPTATLEPTPTPTVTPTPSPTPLPPPASAAGVVGSEGGAASQVAVVRSGGAGLLASPDGEPVGSLSTGTALTLWARSDDGAWLAAVAPNGTSGWVRTADVVAFNVDRLPVAQAGSSREQPSGIADVAAPVPPAENDPASIQGGIQERPVPAAALTDLGITATVAVTDSRLNIRSGPDTSYRVVDKALPGERYSAVGRTADSKWIQILGGILDAEGGWVAAEFVALGAPVMDLPVADSETDGVAPSSASSAVPAAPVADGSLASQNRAGTGLRGNLVVQSSLGGDIYVVNLETGASRYLVSGFDPAISPDGRTVAFTRDGGGQGLYLIDMDGGNERRIYAGGEGLRSPTWSPDGRYVLFSRLAGSYECRDVGFGICLPDNPFLSDFDMTTKPEYGLSRVNVDGGEFRDLPALTSAKAASWSVDGITYQSNTGLELTSDDPNARTSLLLSAPYYQDPDWQPGGSRIIFQSREGSHWEVFSVNTDGNGLFALTRPVTTLVDELPSNVSPTWSPDGRYIVYLSSRDDDNSKGEWRLWVMNEDGSDQRPLAVDLPIGYTYSAEQVVDWGPASE